MVHRRFVYIYLLNVPSFSSRYFNKIKRTSRLGRLLALSLEILFGLCYSSCMREVKALVRLYRCAGLSVPSLLAVRSVPKYCVLVQIFFGDMAHKRHCKRKQQKTDSNGP